MVCLERLFDDGSARNRTKYGVLEHYVAQSKKFKGQVGALMRAIDFLAETASSTHFRALF